MHLHTELRRFQHVPSLYTVSSNEKKETLKGYPFLFIFFLGGRVVLHNYVLYWIQHLITVTVVTKGSGDLNTDVILLCTLLYLKPDLNPE